MAYDAGDFLIQARMESVTGLPADRVINDFAVSFIAGVPDTDDIEAACDMVGQFYTLGDTAPDKVGNYISPYVDRGSTHELAAYQVVAGPLGSPAFTKEWLGPPVPTVDDGLPEECAGVLSFHADLTGVLEEAGATRPRARRRGRVYVGPLTLEAVDYDIFPVRLKAAFRTALQARAVALYDDLETYGWRWSVWSRADALLRPIVGGWTDNAADTQRRRGPAASARSTFTTV